MPEKRRVRFALVRPIPTGSGNIRAFPRASRRKRDVLPRAAEAVPCVRQGKAKHALRREISRGDQYKKSSLSKYMGILGGQALRRSCFQRDEKEKKLAGVGQAPAGVGCSFTEKKAKKRPYSSAVPDLFYGKIIKKKIVFCPDLRDDGCPGGNYLVQRYGLRRIS